METNSPTPLADHEHARRQQAKATAWKSFGHLFAWRRFIIGVTLLGAAAAVVISLLLPNWYKSSARLLIPDSSGSGLTGAVLNNLPAAASALLGGGGSGDYSRYMTILTSRSLMTEAVNTFDLIQVYDVADSRTPMQAAINKLRDNVEFDIDMEFDFMTISAYDTDPMRAANLTEYFVRRLNEVNERLLTENAGNYRKFIENRYFEARDDLDSVLVAVRDFQQEYGVYDFTTQAEAFFEQVADLRQVVLEAEIQRESMLAQFGAENPTVQSLNEVVKSASQKYEDVLSGSEQLLPVAQSDVPEVIQQYAQLEIERTIQVTILEVLGPVYEQARMQEERESLAVQVVDHADVPVLKSKPKRSVICVLATLSVFLLSILFVLIFEWWRESYRDVLTRLKSSAAK